MTCSLALFYKIRKNKTNEHKLILEPYHYYCHRVHIRAIERKI